MTDTADSIQIPETKYLSQVLAEHCQDMTGKRVAITGTTSGTGFVCARELAKLGAQVLLLNRPSERSEAALSELRRQAPSGNFAAVDCDLQSFDSVRAAAARIQAEHRALDVLCHNAGVMALPDQATNDGYDVQMQTNSISPFLLSALLFPQLKESAEARVVSHSSLARLGSDHEARYFQKLGGALGGDGAPEESANFAGPRWERYHQSKLANCTFTYGLQQRLKERGISNVKALLAHPGVAHTGLQASSARTGGMDAQHAVMQQAQSAEDGALGIVRACADPTAQPGDFYGPREMTGLAERLVPEDLLQDPKNIALCWQGCEAAVGEFRF